MGLVVHCDLLLFLMELTFNHPTLSVSYSTKGSSPITSSTLVSCWPHLLAILTNSAAPFISSCQKVSSSTRSRLQSKVYRYFVNLMNEFIVEKLLFSYIYTSVILLQLKINCSVTFWRLLYFPRPHRARALRIVNLYTEKLINIFLNIAESVFIDHVKAVTLNMFIYISTKET